MNSRVHFPGLNSLRFYAAICVVIGHLGDQLDTPTVFSRALTLITLNSQSAVDFFFVLSGFLITFLLLQERMTRGKINIRAFYIRRALRIWPLYFLIAWLGLFLFRWIFGASYQLANVTVPQILLTLFFLPNFAALSAPLAHLWSIGIEEQFYLVWPLAARGTSVLFKFIFGIFFLKILIALVDLVVPSLQIGKLLADLRFECMALGGLVSWLYIEKHPFLQWLYHPLTQALAILGVLILIIFDFPSNLLIEIASSTGFAILILNVATNPQTLLRLNHPLLERLGKISYGIYMYHFPVIFLIVFAMSSLHLDASDWSPLLLYVTSIAATLIVAALSYRWFEQPFLHAQKRFSPIASS